MIRLGRAVFTVLICFLPLRASVWQWSAPDGLTFRLRAGFLDTVPASGGPITFSRIVGPFVQLAPDTFRLRYGRAEYTANHRNHDLRLVAVHPGDERHRAVVQQAMVRVAPVADGAKQTIDFPAIPDQTLGGGAGADAARLKLGASSDAGLSVCYHVLEGPAEIDGDTLRFTAIPPRAKFPIKVTVVAWQSGRAAEPRVQTAARVERGFLLQKWPASASPIRVRTGGIEACEDLPFIFTHGH